ncbi:N-acetylneuraminate epimerase [Flavobacterium sp. PL11]|uniref:galactose oxidase n=1 Tax=Flavobacterium sp. PL11 TaxID=3071717 RepID=UPI002DFD60B3|nr:N-acetylneuraminate epimerase [Flavobacterium sp. PL11]
MATTDAFSQKKEVKNVKWKTATQLENADGSLSLGFAGSINGISNDALVVTGGANFPDKMPWEGGKKYYSKTIHILKKCTDEFSWIIEVRGELPEPIAYCGSTTASLGVVYVGGENENGLSNRSYLLNWNKDKKQTEVTVLPDYPIAAANISLAQNNNVIYAIGGDEAAKSSDLFASLDLKEANPKWKILPTLPMALANAVVIAQQGKNGMNIYVIGGRTKTASGISDLHNTTFIFDLKKQAWETAATISDGKKNMNFSAGAGVAVGAHSLLIIGGDDGVIFHQIETYLSQIANAKSEQEKADLIAKKNQLVINHQGFYNGVLLYNTIENTWSKIDELPFLPHVTSPAVLWDKKIILSSGEIKPGVRTPNIMLGSITK